MIWINEYHKILREYNLEENNGHLLLPKDLELPQKRKLKIVRDIFSCLGDLRASDKNFKLMKKNHSCPFSNCVSPQCFKFVVSIKNYSMLDEEDVIEIARTMDLERIEMMGAKKYLEEYNKTQPDIFKISQNDFKIILSYMKGKMYDD